MLQVHRVLHQPPVSMPAPSAIPIGSDRTSGDSVGVDVIK